MIALCTEHIDAKVQLVAWISWASRCRLAPFKRLAGTIKKHLTGIVEHFRSGLNNGFAEAINGRVQAAKARAKGYSTDEHLMLMSYLVCGKLKHLPKNPRLYPARPMSA